MASQSSRTQAVYPVPGIFWAEWGLDLESVSGLAFLEDMGGAGITGDTTGTEDGSQPQHLHFSQPNNHQSQQLQFGGSFNHGDSTVAMRSTGADRAAEVGSEFFRSSLSARNSLRRVSGFDHGGNVRGFSTRGRSALEAVFMGGGGGRTSASRL